MKKNFLVLGLFFLFTLIGYGQNNKPNYNTLPEGVQMMKPTDAQNLFLGLKQDLYPKSEDFKGSTNPMIAIRIVGDASIGVSVFARNTGRIPAGSILIGAKQYPGGYPEYMNPLYVSQDIDPENFWFQIEKERKSVYFVDGGVAVYQMLVLYNGQLSVFSADKRFFDTNGNNAQRRFITGGNAVGRKIQLFGNFSGSVGAVLYDSGSTFEWVVPTGAFTNVNQFSVTINTDAIPGFGNYSGDISVTLVDGRRISDYHQVLLSR